MERQGCLDWETAADVDRIQRITNLSEFTILEDEAAEFTPVVCGVLDTRVDEKVEHLKFRLFTGCNSFFVERCDVAVTNAKTRRVKLKLRFFVGGDSDTHFVAALDIPLVHVELTHLVEDGDAVVKPFVEQFGDVLRI